jgi:hypothetical protein
MRGSLMGHFGKKNKKIQNGRIATIWKFWGDQVSCFKHWKSKYK